MHLRSSLLAFLFWLIPALALGLPIERLVPASAGNVFTADGANYYVNFEDCISAGPIGLVVDATSPGGRYAANTGTDGRIGMIVCEGSFANATYYGAISGRGQGGALVAIDTSPFTLNIPRSKYTALDSTAQFTHSLVWAGYTGTVGGTVRTNSTTRRSWALNGTHKFYFLLEAPTAPTGTGAQLGRFVLTASAATDPSTVGTGGGGGTSSRQDILEVGANTITVDGSGAENGWANAPVIDFTGGYDNGVTATTQVKALWKDAATNRFYFLATITKAGLLGTASANDTGQIFSDTGLEMRLCKNRADDTSCYLLAVSIADKHYDANFTGVDTIDSTFSIGNLSHAVINSTNTWTIEIAGDLFSSTAADQIFACFRINERTSGGTKYKDSCPSASNIDDNSKHDIYTLSATTVPAPPADTTNPTVASCSATNVGNNSFDATCTPSDDSGGALTIRVIYGTSTGIYTTTVTRQSTCASGVACVLNIPNLTAGTGYFWRMCAVDPTGNPTDQSGTLGCSAEVGPTTTTSTSDVYIATNGSDSNNGSSGAPWRTFAHAIPLLTPGSRLLVKNGTYGQSASTGLPSINCGAGGNAVNGTSSQPITIEAENQRQAILNVQSGAASAVSLTLRNCSWWRIIGLTGTTDNTSGVSFGDGAARFKIAGSSDILAQYLMAYGMNANEPVNGNAGIEVTNSSRVTVEYAEVYKQFRHNVISVGNGNNDHVFRNIYCNRQGQTKPGDQPGACITNYGAGTLLAENIFMGPNGGSGCGNGASLVDQIGSNGVTRLLNGASVCGSNGGTIFIVKQDTGAVPTGTVLKNLAIITPQGDGIDLDSANQTVVQNVTTIGGGSHGIVIHDDFGVTNGATGTNIMGIGAAGYAWRAISAEVSTVDYIRAFNNATGTTSNTTTTNLTTTDPSMGSCYLWAPDASNTLGTGLAGGNIGARVLYRYVNGVETATKLWDTTTHTMVGAGATVTGMNDSATNSLIGIGAQMHLGAANGCAYPAGY